ncbi:FtsX-like permease family protein [Nonomuraea angiospora]|uniref:FtsX-like permease family protein n=1 Tax=Nonomuraea angiospora TaxID=46172 RepID=UPI0033252282
MVERTREFAVMQAIGATSRNVLGIVLGETIFVGLLIGGLAVAAHQLDLSALIRQLHGG